MSDVSQLNFSWPRYALIAVPLAVFVLFMAWAQSRAMGFSFGLLATPAAVAVILMFLARRWSVLRTAHQAGELRTMGFKVVLGSLMEAFSWWLAAVVVGIAFVLVPWLLS